MRQLLDIPCSLPYAMSGDGFFCVDFYSSWSLTMGIDFGFACRECGAEVTVRYDTSKLGRWSCVALCDHVSGELVTGYTFREEHRPSWERMDPG